MIVSKRKAVVGDKVFRKYCGMNIGFKVVGIDGKNVELLSFDNDDVRITNDNDPTPYFLEEEE